MTLPPMEQLPLLARTRTRPRRLTAGSAKEGIAPTAKRAPVCRQTPTWPPSGQAWTCKREFRKLSEMCVAVDVPPYARLNGAGDGWTLSARISRERRRYVRGRCRPCGWILARRAVWPGWRCDYGYRSSGNTCAAIVMPQHAYLTDSTYRPGWRCDRRLSDGRGAVCDFGRSRARPH